MADQQLTAKSSIGDWLKHPVGGPLIRDMLAQAGMDEKVLAPVRLFSLQRLQSMSGGQMSQELVDDLVARANGDAPAGDTPASETAATTDAATTDTPATPASEPWTERITPGRFAGRTVIVTGAGSGIGRATASRIAREGGRVVGVDVSADCLAAFAAEHADAEVVTLVADITSAEDVARIVTAAGDRIDGVANVAGIMDDMTPLHEVSDDVWRRVFSVNVDGMFLLTRAALPAMLAAGAGSVVNVASEAGLRGSAAGAAYTASKHAVVGLTKSSAFMYAETGIRFNAVAPGPVATSISATFASELGQARVGGAMAILPAIAEASQLAASITWLLSDDATNVTGVILPSDGGWSAT
jgi:NAD(P)-dependent dehydrogenase (short-subunit alcohol dehydrogenase family)